MDAQRFDTWTRRRFGLGLGGLGAALLGLTRLDDVAAKTGKGKKGKGPKCQKAGTGCNPVQKGKRGCCAELTCQVVPGFGAERCCAATGASCAQAQECCSGSCVQGGCA